MGTLVVIAIVFLVFVLGAIFWGVGVYNRLVTLRGRFQNAFSQIEIQMKRRYDTIPNLVEVVKAAAKHERETLEAVIAARNRALSGLEALKHAPGNAQQMAELGAAEGMLQSALGRLSVVVEAYPDLKANSNFAQLTEELTSTENKIAFARQAFNDAVTDFNTYKRFFPQVILAGMFGFAEDATLLKFSDSEPTAVAPKLNF